MLAGQTVRLKDKSNPPEQLTRSPDVYVAMGLTLIRRGHQECRQIFLFKTQNVEKSEWNLLQSL